MTAWLLVAYLAADPRSLISLGSFTSREECEARVLWLDESGRKRAVRREYACLEVPTACALPQAIAS